MTLLAKAVEKGSNLPPKTLQEHIEDCLRILALLRLSIPKVGQMAELGQAFWELLRLAIICHDTGKAHRQFQALLNRKPNTWNSQRHEFFSIPFVSAIKGIDPDTIRLLELVVVGHHKDIDELSERLNRYESGSPFNLLQGVSKSTFGEAFAEVDVDAVGKLLQHFGIEIDDIRPISPLRLIRGYKVNNYSSSHPDFLKLTLLFGGLKLSDHMGSAGLKSIERLAHEDFRPLDRLDKLYTHQKQCAETSGNLVLIAPTGSGKTESALFWLRKQLASHGQARCFFILPYTASINAAYERLRTDLGDEKVGMLHGKLNDYLNNYFDDLQYDLNRKKATIAEIRQQYRNLTTPLKVVTPFQLLKHLFGIKGFEQGLFEMTGCYLIFDEIHAYRPDVFAQIKVLIEFAVRRLEAKVMIMTATLPSFLMRELSEAINEHATIRADKVLYDQFTRHKVRILPGKLSEKLDMIKAQLAEGRKVLVVCNTVKSSQNVYKTLASYVEKDRAVLLHGRFAGVDRTRHEKRLRSDDIQLLVGTQAIEVSLDIDYDFLFTEPAPIDALIQRFGRVNRKREKGICDCIVFSDHNPEDVYIYNEVHVNKTLEVLSEVAAENGGIIHEARLQEYIDRIYIGWSERDKREFEQRYQFLTISLPNLAPLVHSRFTENDFFNQFDGVPVLPQHYLKRYRASLDQFDFITAESYKVTLSSSQYAMWRKNQNIRQEHYFAVDEKDRAKELSYLVTNKKYDPVLGLIGDDEEPWSMEDNFL